MVNEETRKNPVVVDEKTGLPKRDKFGRIVVIGTSTAGAEDKYQDIQQNTADRLVPFPQSIDGKGE